MCEIAIVPNIVREHGTDPIVNAGKMLAEANKDGFGIVAVYTDGATFSYKRYKAERPLWTTRIPDFIEDHDDAWRFVLHARAATVGGTGFASTHPILTRGCHECDIDYVLHNGSVSGHHQRRKRLEREGHEFTTKVDSEVIAHAHGSVPSSLDELDAPTLRGSLNYILLAPNGILIRTTTKYEVSERLKMACKTRGWDIGDAQHGYHLFTPNGDYDFEPIRSRTTTATTAGAYGWGWRGAINRADRRRTGTASNRGETRAERVRRSTNHRTPLAGKRYQHNGHDDEDDDDEEEPQPVTIEVEGVPDDEHEALALHGDVEWDYCYWHDQSFPLGTECSECVKEFGPQVTADDGWCETHETIFYGDECPSCAAGSLPVSD